MTNKENRAKNFPPMTSLSAQRNTSIKLMKLNNSNSNSNSNSINSNHVSIYDNNNNNNNNKRNTKTKGSSSSNSNSNNSNENKATTSSSINKNNNNNNCNKIEQVHPLAYSLGVSRYEKFITTRLSNELVDNIKDVDTDLRHMQKAMRQPAQNRKGRMKQKQKQKQNNKQRSSRTGMAWMRRIELKMAEVKSLQISLNIILPNILKIEESNKRKYVFLTAWRRSYNNYALDVSVDGDGEKDARQNSRNNMIKYEERFNAPPVYNSQCQEIVVEKSSSNHQNRITLSYRKARNQNKEMTAIVKDAYASASETIQNFIVGYYCVCHGCQTMYNKQYTLLFGAYEENAARKYFCVDCWSLYCLNLKIKQTQTQKQTTCSSKISFSNGESLLQPKTKANAKTNANTATVTVKVTGDDGEHNNKNGVDNKNANNNSCDEPLLVKKKSTTNDKLVDFLVRNGSMAALNEYMDGIHVEDDEILREENLKKDEEEQPEDEWKSFESYFCEDYLDYG